jgi:glycosyltransferase involved in cell wall biosynthesis
VLFLGSLVPRKRLGVLLEALRQVPGEHWSLDVVGREDANDYVRSMKRRARALDGRVRFHGACSDGRLQNLLGRSHVMALPSAYEGFGIAYVEAMGKGMPVIATTNGAAGEYVESGRNGALVAPDDPDAVASWIRRLAADRARLAEMGLEARATYVDMPQWSDTTARIRDFLQRVVAGTIGRHECIGTG